MTSRYLNDDREASAVARKLRRFSDDELAWIPHLSEIHRMMVSAYFGCDEFILDMAQRYELARRRAYPIAGNEAADRPCRFLPPATLVGCPPGTGA